MLGRRITALFSRETQEPTITQIFPPGYSFNAKLLEDVLRSEKYFPEGNFRIQVYCHFSSSSSDLTNHQGLKRDKFILLLPRELTPVRNNL